MQVISWRTVSKMIYNVLNITHSLPHFPASVTAAVDGVVVRKSKLTKQLRSRSHLT